MCVCWGGGLGGRDGWTHVYVGGLVGEIFWPTINGSMSSVKLKVVAAEHYYFYSPQVSIFHAGLNYYKVETNQESNHEWLQKLKKDSYLGTCPH